MPLQRFNLCIPNNVLTSSKTVGHFVPSDAQKARARFKGVKCMYKFYFSFLFIISPGCVSQSQQVWKDPPCFDGWAYNEDKKSKLWIPSKLEAEDLRVMIPNDRILYCWHEMPDGSYTAINSDQKGEHYQTSFHRSGKVFIKGEEYELITVH